MTDPADETDDTEEVIEMDTTEPTDPDRGPDRDADAVLLAELKQALAATRSPNQDRVIADAQDAFVFLAVQDEFAALVFDSLWEDELETNSRALDTIRTLTFETAGLSLEIEISADGIVGQVAPPGAASVQLERGDGRRSVVETDELGSFTLVAHGPGPVRFHVSRGGIETVTDWVNAAG